MVTKRSVAMAIILSIVTCGIYGLYWFVKLTDEMNYASGSRNDTSGIMAFVLTIVTCGIYTFYWAYKMGIKADIVERTNSSKGILYLILTVLGLGIIVYALAQDTLNRCA